MSRHKSAYEATRTGRETKSGHVKYYELSRTIVRSLLDELGIKAESSLHGFEIERHVNENGFDHMERWRLQHGGGISGNSVRIWWLVEVVGSKPPTGPSATTRSALRRLLTEWMAGDPPPVREGYHLYAKRHTNKFGTSYVWNYRKVS